MFKAALSRTETLTHPALAFVPQLKYTSILCENERVQRLIFIADIPNIENNYDHRGQHKHTNIKVLQAILVMLPLLVRPETSIYIYIHIYISYLLFGHGTPSCAMPSQCLGGCMLLLKLSSRFSLSSQRHCRWKVNDMQFG